MFSNLLGNCNFLLNVTRCIEISISSKFNLLCWCLCFTLIFNANNYRIFTLGRLRRIFGYTWYIGSKTWHFNEIPSSVLIFMRHVHFIEPITTELLLWGNYDELSVILGTLLWVKHFTFHRNPTFYVDIYGQFSFYWPNNYWNCWHIL